MREEEKARRDYEKAELEAGIEERKVQKSIDEAKKLLRKEGAEFDSLNEKIKELETKLLLVQEYKERAISMAQQTKRGFIYIISNIGSFGEDVYKIGMTRRLDPTDRVKELGDASVPFHFDIHAMIYSENAPALENELHKAFVDKKINMMNNRKEFFRISLEDIELKMVEMNMTVDFIKTPEAMQYRESQNLALKKMQFETQRSNTIQHPIFPDKLPQTFQKNSI
ncbi:MAG: GIY-YIG nuclease family protein [Crocinitomicaceae bacterium]|nr:GIY-YIG nuclease family protein [Crocinitomicaceae bacterium]